MISQVAADVVTIRHLAYARDATAHGVALATLGRHCAGNATDYGMNSTIVVSFSQDAEVPEAMADSSDDIEKFIPCTATEHAQATQALLQNMPNMHLHGQPLTVAILCTQLLCNEKSITYYAHEDCYRASIHVLLSSEH